ncbi:MAG: type II toxin-antitoxin system RelE/ParE family toxin [Candidatus Micrarchaeia archaeon]
MAWKIELSPEAEKELDELDPQAAKRILLFLRDRLSKLQNPRRLGKTLKGSHFKTLWRYRVGDYRLICNIEDTESKILVLRIGHRKEVYR